MKNNNNIEELYKSAFEHFEAEPSGKLYGKFNRKLWWFHYKKLVYGAAIILLFAGATLVSLPFFNNQAQYNPVTEQITNKKELHTSKQQVNSETGATGNKNPETEKTTASSLHVNHTQAKEPEANNSPVVISENRHPEEIDTKLLSENSTQHFPPINELNNKEVQLKLNIRETLKSNGFAPVSKNKFYKNRTVLSLYLSGVYNKAETLHDNYPSEINVTCLPSVDYGAGAGIRYFFGKWFLETGLNYSRFSQKTEYDITDKILDTELSGYRPDTIWGWFYDPPHIGVPVAIGIDSSRVDVYKTIHNFKTVINRHEYLEVPLMAGYSFGSGRFGFDIAAGISAGFLMNVNGEVFSDDRFVPLDKNTSNEFILNGLIKIGINYRVTEKYDLFFRPFYKKNLQPVFKSGYPLEQKFNVFGINAGVNIYLR